MLGFLQRKLRCLLSEPSTLPDNAQITGQIDHDLDCIAAVGGDDLKIRRLVLPGSRRYRCAVAYLDGLNTAELIGELVLRPMLISGNALDRARSARDAVEVLGEAVLQVSDLGYTSDQTASRHPSCGATVCCSSMVPIWL